MIAYLTWLAALDAVFSFARDPWFYNWAAMLALMLIEQNWRKQAQRQRDYWIKETEWWIAQSDKWVELIAPIARAGRLGLHYCHDGKCVARKSPHECHAKCAMRSPRRAS